MENWPVVLKIAVEYLELKMSDNHELENEERTDSSPNKYKANLRKFNQLISRSQNQQKIVEENLCKFDSCKLKR